MINWGFDVNPIGDIVTFESDASPYFARNLELRFADLWGFEGGIGYVTNQLLGAAGFTARSEIVGIDDPIASVLLGNLARDIGPIRIGPMSRAKLPSRTLAMGSSMPTISLRAVKPAAPRSWLVT